MDYFEEKCYSLESFYSWVDQGSDYDLAVRQTLHYDHITDKMVEIIENITIAILIKMSKIFEEFVMSYKEVIGK